MNQIICTKYCSLVNLQDDIKHSKKRFPLKIYFFILFCISISSLTYYLYFNYDLYSHEKVSKSLMDSFEITKIYQNSANYSAKQLNSEEVFFYENSSFSVIGSIDIKKINISYPILSDISKDFLKISPCRFYGPMPNKVR